MKLPQRIAALLKGENYRLDQVGMSRSSVLLFSDRVLKIQESSEEALREYRLMDWLQGKLPVPRVLAWEEEDGLCYLLMSRVQGEMACADRYMNDPPAQAALLANALKALWAVDATDCPVRCSLAHKLQQARYNVENHLADLDNVQPDTFGEGGFSSPEALLQWLTDNQPPEEPALTHGDFCLPNVFFSGNSLSGFIDWGRGGVGDKWNDIALCYRSLRDNHAGCYGGTPNPRCDDGLLFRALGLKPDWQKIRYYILLDELF